MQKPITARERTSHEDDARRLSTPVVVAAVLAALGGAALYNRSRAKRAERDAPRAGQFIEVDGVRLHYVERGQGRPVVLLHGNGTMIQDFEVSGLLDQAAGHYRVIAFDRPGFGYSERPRSTIWTAEAQADLLHKALGLLDVDQPIIVGHSWGTLVTLALALNHPEDVGAIVLLSGYYYPSVRADALLSAPAMPIVGDVLRYTVLPPAGRMMTPAVIKHIFSPAPVTREFARFPIELSLRPSQLRATAADTALMIPGAAALNGRYGELLMPVVIVAGDGDKIVDFEQQAVRLHEALPGSELRIVPGAGHMVHHTVPNEVVAAIETAVQKLGRHAALAGDAERVSGLPTG